MLVYRAFEAVAVTATLTVTVERRPRPVVRPVTVARWLAIRPDCQQVSVEVSSNLRDLTIDTKISLTAGLG